MSKQNTDPTKIPMKVGKGQLGQSGTYNWNGIITGEEYNFDLTGTRGLHVYDIMRKSDAAVHAVLLVVKNPIVSASWDIEPASDDPADIEIANFVKRELFDRKIEFPDKVREALTCLDFGHAVFEKGFELTEFNGKPRIGLSSFESRKQRSILRWETEDHQEGITQILSTGSQNSISIPRAKLAYFINEREGTNWLGTSLLRFAFKPWKIKDALDIMLAVALERKAVGVPVIKKGMNNTTVSEQELEKAREAIRNLYANEESYLEIPDGVDITMLDLSAVDTKDVLSTIEHQNTQITLSVLAQFLMLGSTQGGTGSRAVSADHSSLFVKSLEAVARVIQQPLQNDVVNQLVDLNYSDVKNGYPRLVFSDLSDDDIQATSEAVSSLMQAGAITKDPDVENRLRKMLSLPPLSEEAYNHYEELHQTPDTTPTEGKPDANTPKDKQTEVKKAKKQLPDEKKKDPKEQADRILRNAQENNTKLIDVILRS